jgi:hypothetical protein
MESVIRLSEEPAQKDTTRCRGCDQLTRAWADLSRGGSTAG